MNSVAMICAHRWEADPFLKIADMSAYQAPQFPFPVFRNEQGSFLILSGQGYLRTAAAVSAFLSHHGNDVQAVGNFGVAGAAPGDWSVGQPVLLNKVVDHSTGKSYFPERQLPSPWAETWSDCRPTPLTSVLDREKSALLPPPVYDMESAPFFGTVEQYLSTSQLLLGKVVSDNLVDADPQEIRKTLREPYEDACEVFWDLLLKKGRLIARDPRREAACRSGTLTEELLEELKKRLPLTVNQERDLRARLTGRLLVDASPDSLENLRTTLSLTEAPTEEPWTKPRIKRQLEKILGELEQTL